MTTLLPTLLTAICGIGALVIFIQCVRDLVIDSSWFRSTKYGMDYHNRKNKVEILTEEEYHLIWSGKTVEAE